MKHYTDLTEEQRSKFADDLGADLEKFFTELRSKYDLCNTCLHNAVVMMCENYIEDMSEMPSDAKH